MSENELGVEAVRVLVGDHGVEVLRDILQEMGAGDERQQTEMLQYSADSAPICPEMA